VDLSDLAGALLLAVVAAIPLGLTLWSLLDAARRPQWAWALADRRQVVWLAVIMFSAMTVIGGLATSFWYLTKIRPRIAAAEEGHL
jgi:hypothetical protein